MTEPTLEHRMLFDFLQHDGHPPIPVPVALTFSRSDPYVISAGFRPDHDDVVWWTWGRDMVRDGLLAPTGAGDVTFAPMPEQPGFVHVVLDSPSGHGSFTACAFELGQFVVRTYDLVPAGTELSQIDLDGLLAELLDNSAGGGTWAG